MNVSAIGCFAFIILVTLGITVWASRRSKSRSEFYAAGGKVPGGLNGLVGFSSRPLQLMSMVGFAVAAISFALGMWYAIQKLIGVNLTPGLPTTVLVVSFFSGVQLLSLGFVGEYIGRIYDETKRRPMYIVDRKVNFSESVGPSADRA